jgi:hypothetical protein
MDAVAERDGLWTVEHEPVGVGERFGISPTLGHTSERRSVKVRGGAANRRRNLRCLNPQAHRTHDVPPRTTTKFLRLLAALPRTGPSRKALRR